MTSKNSNGSRKDPLKTPKVWERARREKMKIYFNELQEILPFYDPSAPMSRFEILQKSKMYIKDLQDQNQDLLNGGFDEVYKIKMMKLKQRVKELLKRVDQLTDLLRTANIMIPPLETYPEGVKNPPTFKWMSQHPKKWTEKINLVVPDEKIKSVLTLIKDYKKNSSKVKLKKKPVDKNSEKSENRTINDSHLQKPVAKKKKLLKKPSKVINLKSKDAEKSDSFPGSQSPSQFKENQPVDFNLLSNSDSTTSKSSISSEQTSSVPVVAGKVIGGNSNSQILTPGTCVSGVTIPQNVIIPSVPNVLQSNTYILTNDGSLLQLPILNSSGTVLSANSNLLTPAVVKPTAGLLTPLVINKPSPVIVLQKPAPQIIQAAQIINTAPQVISVSKPNVQILGGTNVYTTSNAITTAKTLPHILSKAPTNKKRIARDSTVTTYVNKIPIPALSKQSYAKKSVPVDAVSSKEKTENVKSKNILEENSVKENGNENEKESENTPQNESSSEVVEEEKEKTAEHETPALGPQKRGLTDERTENNKKQKLDEENVFKPIESEADGVFCNLALPNSINPSLSVSPTAAFLSSFPIVAASRSEAEDEITEKKSDDQGKNAKGNDSALEKSKEGNGKSNVDISKGCLAVDSTDASQGGKEKVNEQPMEQLKLLPDTDNNKNSLTQLDHCKSWDPFHHDNCDIRPEAFYMPPDNTIQINNSVPAVDTVTPTAISFSVTENNLTNAYKSYGNVKNNITIHNSLNDQVGLKNNHFEYSQKDNYISKVASYNERPLLTKNCSSNMTESYNVAKTQSTSYQIDPTPNYQLLVPSKETSNQRNSRTVNWMTEPDVPNRGGLIYGSQNDKMTTGKVYNHTDNFYMNAQSTKISSDCTGHFMTTDQTKMNYQKNDFYEKDQRCKSMEKRTDGKTCYAKSSQNSYNIFDYNYTANCFGEDATNKYCQQQQYPGKTKKNITQPKKKSEEVHQVTNELHSNDPIKRPSDQIIANLDFSVTNQECFTWVPGKNVEWLPSKSFGLDTNLVVPSTLPTLVGDLALGTTSTNDTNPSKPMSGKGCQPNLKSNSNDVTKDYMDLGMTNSSVLSKAMESMDANKQYFEPFTNLSKNIFDVTPSNMNNTVQMGKNDFDKINFIGNNSNETIVLKNIFELPVSKSSDNDFLRNKQRTMTNSQNTFFSVSQLVEPPTFEANTMKNETQMESTTGKGDPYIQSYPTYNNQKTYKNKTRSSHCKYNDRKFNGYKNGASSSYTAEALIRSNSQVNYQPNEFSADINTNFFNGKTNQKPEQFPSNNKIDFEINMKTDFSGGGPSQNIYSDFNFSSPVPNFSIAPTVGTEFGNHDSTGNFSAQNNSFFGDFITPEYSLSDNVSNSLLLPPCSIALQNPFVIEKRNTPTEKNKNNSKQYSGSRNRKHYDCSKTTFNEFSIPPTSAIFTTSSITCPTIFTTSACQNLLPVPTQSIPITFSSPSFTTSTISFPPLSSANNNYHRFPNSTQNSSSGSFLPSNTMFTTCTSKPLPSSHSCYSSNPLTSVTNSVISSFPVGNVPFSTSSQSSIPFFSLSNPIIPSSAPTSSSNSLANFNLSTIFPEINQKGNYHYS